MKTLLQWADLAYLATLVVPAEHWNTNKEWHFPISSYVDHFVVLFSFFPYLLSEAFSLYLRFGVTHIEPQHEKHTPTSHILQRVQLDFRGPHKIDIRLQKLCIVYCVCSFSLYLAHSMKLVSILLQRGISLSLHFISSSIPKSCTNIFEMMNKCSCSHINVY